MSLQTRASAELILRQRRAVNGVKKSTYELFRERYRDDPAGFVKDCITWKAGKFPSDYQNELLGSLVEHSRVSVRGPHGLGKTALIAWVVLWFALTRDGVTDWKIPVTASAWRQLTKFAWPEVHKWARQLRWDVIGREPFNERLELTTLSLKLKTGEAFTLASDNSVMIEGAHADEILYILDESKEIPTTTWDSVEGAFSSGKCILLSESTPGEPVGRFYEIQSHKPGFDDWYVRHVTLQEAIASGRINQQWADDRKQQWGEDSAAYQNRVLGEFASSEETGVIPLSWIEAANARWEAWNDLPQDQKDAYLFTCIGLDVARSGEDKTVFAHRYSDIITELRAYSKIDTMATTGIAAGILMAHPGSFAVVDVIGIGAGVVDRLREMRLGVEAFNASEHTDKLDASGELGFVNCRSAAWWNLREMLDPSRGATMALPPDDLLTGDLTAPHWRVMSGGKIQVESKDEIRVRIGRSTDYADAVIQACFSGNVIRPPSAEELSRYGQGLTTSSKLSSYGQGGI
jgi:hypothetical protein